MQLLSGATGGVRSGRLFRFLFYEPQTFLSALSMVLKNMSTVFSNQTSRPAKSIYLLERFEARGILLIAGCFEAPERTTLSFRTK